MCNYRILDLFKQIAANKPRPDNITVRDVD